MNKIALLLAVFVLIGCSYHQQTMFPQCFLNEVTDNTFDQFAESSDPNKPIILFLYAENCTLCEQQQAELNKFIFDGGCFLAQIGKINVNKNLSAELITRRYNQLPKLDYLYPAILIIQDEKNYNFFQGQILNEEAINYIVKTITS